MLIQKFEWDKNVLKPCELQKSVVGVACADYLQFVLQLHLAVKVRRGTFAPVSLKELQD